MSSYPAALSTYLRAHGPRIPERVRRTLERLSPADVGLDHGDVTDEELHALRATLTYMHDKAARIAFTFCTGPRSCGPACTRAPARAACDGSPRTG